ncbi:hypothetical protein ACFX12_031804 [Malus domestica]
MGSGKAKKPSKLSHRNPKNKGRPIGPKTKKTKADSHTKSKKKKEKKQRLSNGGGNGNPTDEKASNQNSQNDNGLRDSAEVQPASASAQLSFFLDKFQSANGVQLSSLELESFNDKCILDLSESLDQDVSSLLKHVKEAFGPSWKQELCGKDLVDGKIDPGSPAVLIISTSALRAIELLRGFRLLTNECRAAKLFSKHMKVEEQVSLLKNRINIASGTPNRIKKLIDIEALGLSRLSVIVLDMHPDVKGYSLITLPQVRDEFWDLYKNYFHDRLQQGSLRLGLYGPLTSGKELKGKKRGPNE